MDLKEKMRLGVVYCDFEPELVKIELMSGCSLQRN